MEEKCNGDCNVEWKKSDSNQNPRKMIEEKSWPLKERDPNNRTEEKRASFSKALAGFFISTNLRLQNLKLFFFLFL